MKTLKKWMMMAALAAFGLTLSGCISFWKGIVEAAVPTIDMAQLNHDNYKYYTYNGKSVKAVYAGTRLNCLYIERRANEQKREAEYLNSLELQRSPSSAGMFSARHGVISEGRPCTFSQDEQIDTSNMPDYFRFVIHSANIKLAYDQSYRMWFPQSETQNDGANGNTLVNLFYQQQRKHPYSTGSNFKNAVVVYEIAPLQNGDLYWWNDGKLYYYQNIYVFDFNAQ